MNMMRGRWQWVAVTWIVAGWVVLPAEAIVTVAPTVETGSAHNTGDTADDSAIWIHPTDPSQSIVIGDDKNGGMMVWNLDGSEIQYLDATKRLNNVDIRYNFPMAGSYSTGQSHTRVALVVVGYENGNSLATYKVNPNTRRLESTGDVPLSISTPYGGCMYRSPVTGKYYYFVNWKSGQWQQVELRDGGGGQVAGTVVRSHDAGGQTEGCVADDVQRYYYIGEEAAGVWRYGAEPGDGTGRVQVDNTGSGHLTADVEGMTMYYKSNGAGYLIVSSQGSSTFQVYQRVPPSGTTPNAFVGEFDVVGSGTIDDTGGTDGMDVTNFPLGSAFSYGLLVVHDASNSGGTASNHKLVPWERVASALGLSSDTSWDPRQVGAGSVPTNTPGPSTTPTRTPTPIRTPTPTAIRTPTPSPTGVPGQLPGDGNGDCKVDGVDFVILFNHYGLTVSGGVTVGDFNLDGKVDGVDYVILLNHYGQVCQTVTTTPTRTPTPTATRTPTPTPPIVTGQGIWISLNELMTRPTSGTAWQSVLSDAGATWGSPDVANQDSNHDQSVLAGALVCARTGQYCDKTLQGLTSAVGTEDNTRWLAVGRNMLGYTIAADLLRAKGTLSGSSLTSVSTWLASFLTRQLPGNNSGVPETLTPFGSGSNASAQEGAVYAAIAAYTGNTTKLNYVWNRFRLYSCDRANNPEQVININTGFSGGWSHTTDYSQACAINPKGTTKQGIRIDGADINDMVRGGNFAWPPGYTQYPWVGMEGYIPAALVLYRAGYPAFQVADQAVLRALDYLWFLKNNTSTDWWEPSRASEVKHLVNVAYGKSFPVSYPTGGGRMVGYTDWTHPSGI